MNAIAFTKDEGLHLWVPATGCVSEMDASFKQLTHGKSWHGHKMAPLLLRLILHEALVSQDFIPWHRTERTL